MDRPEYRWIVSAYVDRGGTCAVACTGRKLREFPPGAGVTTLAVCEENGRLRDQAVGLLEKVGYRGVAGLDYRLDPRDGRFKLLDFNPRQGANFRLLADRDMDVVRAMYLDLTDQHLPACTPRDGRRWVVEPFDLLTCTQYLVERRLTISDWLRSYQEVEELAWFSTDDPAPAVFGAAGALSRAVRRLPATAAARACGRAARVVTRGVQ